MNRKTAFELVSHELDLATNKFPTWPTDPLHAVAIKHEEDGELAKEVVQYVYEPWKTSLKQVQKEAIQSAAMAIRFLMSVGDYDYMSKSAQHTQQTL